MKKSFFIISFILLSLTAFAQITVRPGVRGGVTISNITNGHGDANTDFYVGGYAAIKFTRFYVLQPELTYSRQGTKDFFYGIEDGYDPIIGGFNSFDKDLEIQYLNFTIANKFSPIPNTGLNFIVGPSFNIKVADNYDHQYHNITGFDFALLAGIGYDFPFGLGIEARYNQGLIDIFGYDFVDDYDDDDDNYFDEVYLNSYFQIGLTYTFNF
ncbi:MAG: PorT family protein [Mangrovimonas sp.]|nr:PorT family protein [Mangrovimonas sp.]HPF96401.1 outer membrane beta-barrel protein [Mangrovimonas sp.]